MSSIKLSPNASGTGEFTIAAPNSNTNRTLTLPDQTGTVLTNAGPFTANASASAGAVTIDASNNVGIGTSSPTDTGSFGRAVDINGTTGAAVYARTNGSATQYAALGSYGADGYLINRGAGNLYIQNGGANRAIIDSNGAFGVGMTSPSGYGIVGVRFTPSGGSHNQTGIGIETSLSTSGARFMQFYNEGGSGIGSITRNTTTNAVLYNTSSDYRLKEQVQPLSGALARIAQMRPVQWVWKDCAGATGEGFIAHELQQVVPGAVSGEKDAVDENGKPLYQGMDASYLVATLTAALQELKAQVDAQAAEIAALKGAAS